MTTATINISLPNSLKVEVEKAMESDGYGNTSEFFRDLAREYLKKRQEQKLEALLLEAVEGNDFTPLTKADFEAIKQRGLQRLKDKGAKS
jgi:Arc/MetJ-type ribon-helix-helix transcriptional regulator